jgi:CBS domain-containing protein
MQVQNAMSRAVRVASPQDPIRRVAQLMKEEDAGFIPICEDDTLLGVITDRDIVIRCIADGHQDLLNEPVDHCMTRAPIRIDATASLEDAAVLMDAHEVRRLAVVQDGRLVGVLSHGNLIQATGSDGPADMASIAVTRGA